MKIKISFLLCVIFWVIGCTAEDADENTLQFTQQDAPKRPKKKPEIKIEVVNPPSADCKRKSMRLDVLSMKYTGYLENGTQFESTRDIDKNMTPQLISLCPIPKVPIAVNSVDGISPLIYCTAWNESCLKILRSGYCDYRLWISYDHGQEFSFQLGIGQVIQGWEKGLIDMCVGERRKLTIPPGLAYGTIGAGEKIPPNSTLIFDCELTKIDEGPKPANVFKEIDTDSNGELSSNEVSDFLVKHSMEAGEHIQADSDEHKTVVKSIFQHEDKDSDGVISFTEFSGPKHDEL